MYTTSPVAQRLKRLPAMQETWAQSLGQEDPLEKEMATHSGILAWKIPWTEELGGLQSMGLQRVRYDRATSLSLLCIKYINSKELLHKTGNCIQYLIITYMEKNWYKNEYIYMRTYTYVCVCIYMYVS